MLLSRIPAAHRVNVLNIGLMLVSCAVALYIPFGLFLFAYAVLGPAHYLTEISWLQKRNFFTPRKHDFLFLAAAAAVALIFSPLTFQSTGTQLPLRSASYTFAALGCALVLVLSRNIAPRLIGFLPVLAIAWLLADASGFIVVLLGLFVPTLIHVYVFTGFFMIYGALKERSASGYIAFAIFLMCPLVCWLAPAVNAAPGATVIIPYWNNFSTLNMTILGVTFPQTTAETREAFRAVFSDFTGVTLMRFIAFAYTYHYLNWFSKTSIIKWHEVGTPRLAAIAAIWLGSIGLYLYDFALGFKFLFSLSLAHVYLEFPLNHISILGTFRELRARISPPLEPALAGPPAPSRPSQRGRFRSR
jgi:hypothetical protein